MFTLTGVHEKVITHLFPASPAPAYPGTSIKLSLCRFDEHAGRLWEITTKVEISGLPASLPEHTVQDCVTKKDIEEGKMHQPESRNSKCEVKDYKVEGNKASWNIVCSGDNPTTGSGSVTYSGTSFAGTTKMKTGEKGQETEITQTFNGKRIGACKK